MPFLYFSQSSLNFAFAYALVVFPSGHAERWAKYQLAAKFVAIGVKWKNDGK
jgi:hypothetical protein